MVERSRWAPGAATLAAAARVVADIAFEGRSADHSFFESDFTDDRAAVRAVALGSIRWFLRLRPAVESLLSHPKGVADPIRALLIVSAHQIEYSRNVPQTTVHAAVDATRILANGRASGLVNAVLRKFVADRAVILARSDRQIAARHGYPEWLVKAVAQSWPDACESILAAGNEHPPMVLRLDLSRTSVDAYMASLSAAGMSAAPVDWLPGAVSLQQPVSVGALPGFDAGIVSVQDAGAQLAASLLDAKAGMRVLDACAAPGGKTGHLLEFTPNLAELVAIDIDSERISRIESNLRRLRRTATTLVADAGDPDSFWDGRPFDRILVDAPCSSTGVIRRHPDIKLLRRPTDVMGFARTQAKILGAAWRMLGPGGRLVYSTCSLLPAENEEIVAGMLGSQPAAHVAVMPRGTDLAPGAVQRRIGIQLLPGAQAGTDGFYYACIEKTTVGT